MNWSTSVHTTLSSDTEPSIVITFDSAKYIFNAGENTTRAILQSKRGWKKVKALFLTQLGTQRSSGVPGASLNSPSSVVRSRGYDGHLTTVLGLGLLMSVADSTPRAMQVVGPSGLQHFLASMRFYVFRFVARVVPPTPYSTQCFVTVARNTLGLKVTEIPNFPTEPQAKAVPVFRDDNITVFSIPIAPTLHSGDGSPTEPEMLLDESENVLKRKREHSPELPSKRTILDPTVPTTDGFSTPTTTPGILDRFLSDPKFDPTNLEGDEAEDWRRLIVEHMFTWEEPPPKPRLPPKPTGKKGKRAQNAGDREAPEAQPAQVESRPASLPQVPHWADDTGTSQEKPLKRGPKGLNPAGSLKPLPAFTPPLRGGSTAYIVVGPHVRGKFDVKRADELGLYGPLRGRVARGETVTFTVDDGAGGKAQRTVGPEDCLGEQETTKVRLPTSALRPIC